MTIKQIMLGLSALALSASLAPAAYAATDTGTLTVKARIGAACTLKTKNATLDFGNLTTISDEDHWAQTDITVQCSKDQAYQINLGDGQNMSSTLLRRMKSGENLITYNLFQQPGGTLLWGNHPTWRNGILQATGDGADQKYTIYGQIYKAATTPQAGDYTDTVAIEVTY